MKYVISGASAQMGIMTANLLLEHIPVSDLTLITRSPDSLQSFADRGVRVLAGHHGDKESLKEGYKGANVLFLISSLAVGYRIQHHRDAIDVAKAAGIEHITYTSVAGTHPENPTPSAIEHTSTEHMLWASGISFVALRNQMYSEILFGMISEQALPTGKWIHNSEKGGFNPVARTDIAECAAAIMLNPKRHDRVVYEITGGERYTFPKLAKLAEKLWQTKIEYVPVSNAEMYAFYDKLGVPRIGDPSHSFTPIIFGSDELVNQFAAYEMGLLDITTTHVEFITGKKPRALEAVLTEIIAAST